MFDWTRSQRTVFSRRFSLGLLLAMVAQLALQLWLDQPLQTPQAPRGVVSFELAGDGQRAGEIIASWRRGRLLEGGPSRPRPELQIWLDFPFLATYSTFLALLWLALAGRWRRADWRWPAVRRLAGVLAAVGIAQWVAGAFDLIENIALLGQLGGGTSDQLAGLAHWCARWKFGLLFVGLGWLPVAWLIYRQCSFPILQHLYFCRFPLLLGALLVALGPVAVWGLPNVLGNLFVLVDGEGACSGFVTVTALSLLIAATVVLTLGSVLRHGPERFQLARPELLLQWLSGHRVLVSVLLSLPVPMTAWWASGRCAEGLLGMLIGGGVAMLVLLVADVLQYQLGSSRTPADETLLPLTRRIYSKLPGLRRGHHDLMGRLAPADPTQLSPMPGYRDAAGRFYSAHVKSTLFLLVTLACYGLGYGLLSPDRSPSWRIPALAYLLIVVLMTLWVLPGVSFFADRYRIPTLVALVLASFAVNSLWRADHFYYLSPRATSPAVLTPAMAYDAALRRLEGEVPARLPPPVVVVATSGGGISAALWTTRVLTGLDEDLGGRFAPALSAISSVSGGSVGTLFYLDALAAGRVEEHEKILSAAAAESLDAAVWGVSYPDLWRVIAPFIARPALDRGWALEQAWRRRLYTPNATLGRWRARVAAGELPVALMNATVVETGEQFLLTPIDIPTAGEQGWGARSLFAETAGDIDLTTAARLSATFPWLTPVTRATIKRGSFAVDKRLLADHLADGGYFDNFGVVSAIHWIENLLEDKDPRRAASLRQRGVVLIRIRAGADPPVPRTDSGPDSRSRRGWVHATVGPVLTMVKVRTSTQLLRNDLEVDLLAEKWRALGVPFKSFRFQLRAQAPLSWKLTAVEQERILASWDGPENRRQRRLLSAALTTQ